METRQYWVCETCGGGYFAGEVGKVHVTLRGLVCRMCVPFLAEGAPRPAEGRMRKAEAPPAHVASATGRRTASRQRIAVILEAHPGTPHTAIARELGITKQAVSAHVAAIMPCMQCEARIKPGEGTRRRQGHLHRGACSRAWDLAQACARAGVA